jgi:hypothetical protein
MVEYPSGALGQKFGGLLFRGKLVSRETEGKAIRLCSSVIRHLDVQNALKHGFGARREIGQISLLKERLIGWGLAICS